MQLVRRTAAIINLQLQSGDKIHLAMISFKIKGIFWLC
jgi:hypothetical protein